MARPRSPAATARALGAAAVAVVAIAATTALLAGSRRAVPTPRAPATVLLPYLVTSLEGGALSPPPALSDGAHLDVPSGWLVRASVGDGIAIGVTWTARVSVEGSAQAPRLRLDGGRLLADVTPGAERTCACRHRPSTWMSSARCSPSTPRAWTAPRSRERARPRGRRRDRGRRRLPRGPLRTHAEPIDPRAAAALEARRAAPAPAPGGIFVTIAGDPAGVEIRARDRLPALTPARLRLVPGTALSLTAPAACARRSWSRPPRRHRVSLAPASSPQGDLANPSSPAPPQSPPPRGHRGVAKAGTGSPPDSSPPSPAVSPRRPRDPLPARSIATQAAPSPRATTTRRAPRCWPSSTMAQTRRSPTPPASTSPPWPCAPGSSRRRAATSTAHRSRAGRARRPPPLPHRRRPRRRGHGLPHDLPRFRPRRRGSDRGGHPARRPG